MRIIKKHISDSTKDKNVGLENVTDVITLHAVVDCLNKRNENQEFYYDLEE